MAKKISLLISLYPVSDTGRLQEITRCLEKNISNPYISEIIILDEGFQEKELLANPKVRVYPVRHRPTFSEFYDYLNPDGFNLLSNNDIWFDQSLKKVKWLFLNKYDLLGLTRTEPDGTLFREKNGDSQDSWFFYGRAEPLKSCGFFMGVPGCESRLAFAFFKKRYRFLNPSVLIKARHEHFSNIRNYDKTNRLDGDYLLSRPVGLLQFHFFRLLLKILQIYKINVIKDLGEAA